MDPRGSMRTDSKTCRGMLRLESVAKRAACVFRLNCRLICNYQVVICNIDLCMCIAHSCHSITWLLCVSELGKEPSRCQMVYNNTDFQKILATRFLVIC